MPSLIRGSVGVVLILAVALTAGAATPSEFYLSMLRKGVAAHDGGRFDQAVTPLRVAAFGLVDSLEQYQLAHIYLTLTYDRLGNPDQARESARRVVSAQRAGGGYGALQLPAETRASFESVARRSLTAADMAILSQAPRTATSTATTNPPPVQQPAQQPVQSPTTTPAQNGNTTTTTTTTTTTRPATTPATTQSQTSNTNANNTNTPPRTTPATTQPPQQQPPAPQVTTPARTPAQTDTASTNKPAPTQTGTASTNKPAPTQTGTASTNKPAPTQTGTASTNKPAPAQTGTASTNKPAPAQTQTAVKPAPAPAQTRPAASAAAPPPISIAARFTAAETALRESRLVDARTLYREILDQPNLARADLLRVAEGFYRARDFAHTLRAFERLGALRREEQPYRYYIAVALYETGQYAKAREELAAVLPYIEETSDVARYRAKIQNAIN